MAWIVGEQKRRKSVNTMDELERQLQLKGFLEEDVAKIELFKFFKNNISIAAKTLMGVNLFPYQHIICKVNMDVDFVLDILGRGSGKSWMAGVFIGLFALLNPGVKIGILSASFRQSKRVFQYLEEIINKPKAALFRQCVGKIEHKNDEWSMQIGSSIIYALPLGDGAKLRGFRFNCIVIDELLLMPERVINEVIIPFLGVVRNPDERAELREAEDSLINAGLMKEEDRYVWPNNKLIGLSSASYQFEYLYKLYKVYEAIITGKEDTVNDEMADKLKGETSATKAIIHLSYEAIPKDIYDQSLLKQAMAQLSESQFAREFKSVFTDDSSGYFKISKMIECSIKEGDSPSIEVKGNPNDKYLLSFDPSWAENATSDDFNMQVFKLHDDSKTGTLVHSYAVHGANLKQHIDYCLYLLHNFNIVFMCGDYNGGKLFIDSCNESSVFKEAGIKLGVFETEFNQDENYQKNLELGKNEYNVTKKHYVILRNPTGDWIRQANELLQANIDHKRIFFAARCYEQSYHDQLNQQIPIDSIIFDPSCTEKGPAKQVEFIEHIYNMILLTKAETALIGITTTPQGHQTFDLPANLKRQTGENRTRKDSYAGLVLGNWAIKIYYDMQNSKKTTGNTWIPEFV